MPDDGSVSTGLEGVGLSRRSALRLGARAAFGLVLCETPLIALAGCAAPPRWEPAELVQALARIVVLDAPGAAAKANADFVVRAAAAGLFGVPSEVIPLVAEDLARRSREDFLKAAPENQARIVGELDRDTFASKTPLRMPWHPLKGLILVSHYTSERGMSEALRYAPVPGRYDPDVIVDKAWRPLANDWAGVSVLKPLASK